ncbi:hypothetical protein [Streptomyces sp. NPDC007088]|uniref:AMP-binding enzyme n=1 Tax=Streptomyces sp. NPDC007088 TaxID=3364773 RepID=UPI0036BC75F8
MSAADTTAARQDATEAGFAEDFFALEGELLELSRVRECAVVPAELPGLGPSVVVAFVPLEPRQEIAGRRAVLAACRRNLPVRYAHAVAVDEVPRTVDGAVRQGELLDQVLPQIARDLIAPSTAAD